MIGNFGAHVIAPGQVRFRLWAPDCERVDLLLEGQDPHPMARDGHDIFEVIVACMPGARYKFRISDHMSIPDPASNAQNGDVHDESLVVDQSYPWKEAGWRGRPWHEAVIYELHVGIFGGFRGVITHLPRLSALGITAIELMPIADFPGQRNWGYDGVLPYAPDTAYGTPNDLKALIDAAHALDLQVFLDVVYNHFGPDGNYLNSSASSFFNQDVHTPWGAAIDFTVPQVKRFFIENALYWIGVYRFDGLRFDAVHAIDDSGFLLEMAEEVKSTFLDRHVHLILENENNDSKLLNEIIGDRKFDAQWTDDWHHCLHVLLTKEQEGYYEDFQEPSESLARCLKEGFAFQGDPSPHAGGKLRGTPSKHLPTTSFVICLQNHDQVGNRALGERLTSLSDRRALRAAIVLLLMTPQIPMIFMGEEFGDESPFLFFADHNEELAEAVRDGRRKEFSRFTIFADPIKRLSIPDPNALATFEMSVPKFDSISCAEENGIMSLYSNCLAIRSQMLTKNIPGTQSIDARALSNNAVTARWRLGNGDILTVAANFCSDELPFECGPGNLLIASSEGGYDGFHLSPHASFAWLETA